MGIVTKSRDRYGGHRDFDGGGAWQSGNQVTLSKLVGELAADRPTG